VRFTFQEEKFDPFFAEAQELFAAHYAELALNQDVLKMDLDPASYQRLEDAGRLFILTVRRDGVLIGYLVAFPMPHHMHYKSAGPVCLTDMYYIIPEFRRGAGAKLFVEFERRMRERKCVQIMTGCKRHQNHGELFTALGWTNSDLTFVKVLR